jgi:alpha-L-rhamnosidase
MNRELLDWNAFFRRWPRLVALVALTFVAAIAVRSAPVHLVEESPVNLTAVAPGVTLVDFGRVAFGNLRLAPPTNAAGAITVHFGEAMLDGRINRNPPGSVRYARVDATFDGEKPLIVAPAADQRNTTQPAAVLTPPEWGVVLPFRWVEIEGWPGELRPE